MQIKVDEIKIKKRIRNEMGDINSLMTSMRKFGLLNNIVINKKRELIAGHRRLEAAKRLGWKTIEAIIIDRPGELEKLELEIEENVQRRDLSSDELTDAYIKLDRLRNPNIFIKILKAIGLFFKSIFIKKQN